MGSRVESGFSHQVAATAVILLKRFGLGTSLLEHDPTKLMLTTIYVACKVKQPLVRGFVYASSIAAAGNIEWFMPLMPRSRTLAWSNSALENL